MRDEEPQKWQTVNSFDELGELTGSRRGTQKERTGARRKPQQKPGGNVPFSQAKAVFLPLVAKIQSLKENGFGFAESDNDTSLFFHRSGAVERNAFDTLRSGDNILAIVGTDPKKPGRRQIVRWSAFDQVMWDDEPPEDQHAWDVMRRRGLAERISRLESLLRPVWYARNWGSIPAPMDLEDDLLCKLLLEHLGGLDVADLSGLDLCSLAGSAFYGFASCLYRNHPDAVALLDHIPTERLRHLGRPGRQLLEGAPEARRPEVIAWFVRAGGADAPESEREHFLTGRTASESAAASLLIAANYPTGAGLLRWFWSLKDAGLLPKGILDSAAMNDELLALLYIELLSQEACMLLMAKASRNSHSRAEAAALRPDLAAEIVWRSALAFDLETDGRNTRQIGIATASGSTLTFDGGGPDAQREALGVVRQKLHAAPMIVGHNVVAWDLPAVAGAGDDSSSFGLVWDTLLVSMLLDPAATSHALGGCHRADGDAADALALFREQLDRLPQAFAASLIIHPPTSTAALMERIARALMGTPLASKPEPTWVADAASERDRPILVPRHVIDDLAWTRGVDVVAAPGAGSLPGDLLVLKAAALHEEDAVRQSSDTRAAVLVGLAERCEVAGIALRVGMLPPWLIDGPLRGAVQRAARPTEGEGRKVCPLPPAGAWWDAFDGTAFRVMSWTGETRLLPAEACPTAALGVEATENRAIVWNDAERCWLCPDPVAARLEIASRPRGFATVSLPTEAVTTPDFSSKAIVPLVPARETFRSGPGSFDAAGYWADVISEVAASKAAGTVRALLVGSSLSLKLLNLLETALVEIGHGAAREDHVSRAEHLKRVARIDGAMVLPMEEWRDWHRLADAQGVALRPLVEALPVEEWHIIEQDRRADEEEATTITHSAIVKDLRKTAAKHLEGWLQESGLVDAGTPPVILDPRAGDLVRSLRGRLEFCPGFPKLPEDERRNLESLLEPIAIRREAAPSDLESMEAFLVAHWQPMGEGGDEVKSFKPTQTDAMQAILSRREDVVVTLPTGEGKSVLFQVPALCRGLRDRRLTLVLSPLRALMKDQVDRLRDQGFGMSVDYLNADRTGYEKTEILEGLLDGRIVLLYVAPERLRDPVFRNVLERRIAADRGLERLVLDEAHCLNQWGFEFRPDYFFAMRNVLSKAVEASSSGTSYDRDAPAKSLKLRAPVLMLSATHTAADRSALAGVLEAARGGGRDVPLLPVPDPDRQLHPLRAHIEVSTERVKHAILGRKEFDKGLPERMPHVEGIVRDAMHNAKRTGQRSGVLIFVTRRTHAEAVAAQIAKTTGTRSEAFHAGLAADLRTELVDEFREGRIDVLVATKAFGMGMDIPDIHYVLHLSPPAYLEDYLQEVGRIGRGARERKKADLGRLPAKLVWSASDFATARDLKGRNEITSASIRSLHEDLRKHARKDRVIVPAHGFGTYSSDGERRALETRCRMSLHWLEEAGRLTIANMISNSLPVIVHPDALRRISREKTDEGQTARALLALILADGPAERPGAGLSASEILLDVSYFGRACDHARTDDTLASLATLRDRGGIAIEWSLSVNPLRLWKQPVERTDALIAEVEVAVEALLKETTAKGAEIDPDALLHRIATTHEKAPPADAEDDPWVGATENDRNLFQEARVWAVKSLALSCGVSLRQAFGKEGLVWRVRLPSKQRPKAERHAKKLLRAVRDLIALGRAAGDDPNSIDAGRLITLMGDAEQGFRSRDYDAVLRLASALRQLSVRGELLPMHYEIALHCDGTGLEDRPELVERLLAVNALASARLTVMEAFCIMPPNARDAFVRDYMACRDAEEVEATLARHLGAAGDADVALSSSVTDLLRRHRGEAVEEHFARFRTSEEPAQWTAITHPYDRPMLVNAGPGAGKTAVLVARIVHLLHVQGLKPDQILVLAFNRAVVQEIRARVAAVFRDLGYGAYTRDLRVETFHSLATRHLGERRSKNKDDVTEVFERELRLRSNLPGEVAGGCRIILVDEFQDANDAIFGIVEKLAAVSGASVFAIGDDDQDITRWNRPGQEFSELYFDRFERIYRTMPEDHLTLGVNYRSGHEIVAESERFLSDVLDRSTVSSRLKSTALRARSTAPRAEWCVDDCVTLPWEDIVSAVQDRVAALPTGRSVAILCRSNADVARLEMPMRAVLPDLRIQRRSGVHRVREQRHVGLWLDHLTRRIAGGDDLATPDLRDDLLDAFRQTVSIPETRHEGERLRTLSALWTCAIDADPSARLSDVVELLQGGLRPDDVDRLLGRAAGRILSTIHKVKGLEFDEVIVMPSSAAFPMGGDDVHRAVVEEARTLYVAGTRAKERFLFLRGAREAAWLCAEPRRYEGAQAIKFLEGKGDEVDLGWTSDGRGYNADPAGLHDYIETNVAIGDPIALGGHGRGSGRGLDHGCASARRQIGFLAGRIGAGGRHADLRVADVVRFSPDAPSPWFGGRTWAYAVLVEGRLL